jgi:hypothetical protein
VNQPCIRHLGVVEVDLVELPAILEMCQPGIVQLRIDQAKVPQVLTVHKVRKPFVGHFRAGEVECAQFLAIPEKGQTGIAHVGVTKGEEFAHPCSLGSWTNRIAHLLVVSQVDIG